jgi:hypothetical protein
VWLGKPEHARIAVDSDEPCFKALAVGQPDADGLAGAQFDAARLVRLTVNPCKRDSDEATREHDT